MIIGNGFYGHATVTALITIKQFNLFAIVCSFLHARFEIKLSPRGLIVINYFYCHRRKFNYNVGLSAEDVIVIYPFLKLNVKIMDFHQRMRVENV